MDWRSSVGCVPETLRVTERTPLLICIDELRHNHLPRKPFLIRSNQTRISQSCLTVPAARIMHGSPADTR